MYFYIFKYNKPKVGPILTAIKDYKLWEILQQL